MCVCVGGITALKNINLQGTMGGVVWTLGKTKAFCLPLCSHVSMLEHLSSLGGAVQISQLAFEALWAWELGCVC